MSASHLHLVEESAPASTRAKKVSPAAGKAATAKSQTEKSSKRPATAKKPAAARNKTVIRTKTPSVPAEAEADAKQSATLEPTGTKPAARKASAKAPQTKKRAATAADVMSTPAVACQLHAPLNEAARLMWEHDLGALVIVDDEGKAMSMITDRDVCMAAYTQGVPLSHGAVASAMARSLTSCLLTTPLDEVRELLAEARIRRLPVLDEEGRPVGMLGLSDVLRESLETLPKDRKRGSTAPAVLQLFDAVLRESSH